MHHAVDALQGLGHGLPIAHVASDERDPVRQALGDRRAAVDLLDQAVEDPDPVAALKQRGREVAAYESGPPVIRIVSCTKSSFPALGIEALTCAKLAINV